MSLLCADRRGVGYSLGRDALKAGRTKQQLPAFDRIPSSKWGVLPLAIKFARAGRSVSIFTENLGTARQHGRVVLLVNEHSASAAEMVAAFASEYGLATLVGTKTPGRFVATSPFKVGHGYRVALPVAAYHTWKGTNLEGRGVATDVETGLDAEGLWQGRIRNSRVPHLCWRSFDWLPCHARRRRHANMQGEDRRRELDATQTGVTRGRGLSLCVDGRCLRAPSPEETRMDLRLFAFEGVGRGWRSVPG